MNEKTEHKQHYTHILQIKPARIKRKKSHPGLAYFLKIRCRTGGKDILYMIPAILY